MNDERREYAVVRDGAKYAGILQIVDMWGVLPHDATYAESALRDCVEQMGATLLHVHIHEYSENGGISGVAILAESHVSIHTWPEYDYLAVDIFVCGDVDPVKGVTALENAFRPERMESRQELRGRVR